MQKRSKIKKYEKIKIRFVADSNSVKDKNIASVVFTAGNDNQVHLLPSGQKSISIGIGKKRDFNHRKFILICRKIVSLAKENKIRKLLINFADLLFPSLKISDEEIARTMAVNMEMANFEFIEFRALPEEGWNFVEEVIVADDGRHEIRRWINSGQITGEGVNLCRTLANTHGGAMTPKVLALRAKAAARNTSIKVRCLGKKEITRLKMGGVLAVAQGSKEEPRFIILEYMGGGKEKPVVLVGKAVTFDSGGLNLKPSDAMTGMYYDMSGGAAVIASLATAEKMRLKKNIIGIIPSVENMPSGSSYRPGDIVKTMSGKTVEVLNTDAEGRVILSDALTYAKKYKPRLVVDIATLTGAAVVALGERASAVFTKDEKLESLVRDLGEKSGDYVWPLPLWDEYGEDIKGTFGDLANMGKNRYGGAITAAIFLYQFAKDYKWLHIDMAPRMTAIDGEFLSKGASGAPVRLLIELLRSF